MELFAIFDDNGVHQGLVPRETVHQLGMWHKSSQVFVFNPAGELLLAQRATDKDLYADLWDYSVGEHLQPGETHEAAGLRGLLEELGIEDIQLEPLGGERRVVQRGDDFWDREIQQAFQGVFEGDLIIDAVEVQAVEYVDLAELKRRIDRNPSAFTPWLLEDLREFSLLDR